MKKLTRTSLFITMALVLSACGGGTGGGSNSAPGNGSSTNTTFSAIKVFGDSLSDSGVFKNLSSAGYGRVFSVNGVNTKIWTEVLAAKYGISGPCNYYTTANGSAYTTVSGCTSYAVGGATIINTTTGSPQGISQQLADASTVGSYTDSDLVLIDGGGNDAAALITKFLEIALAANADKPAKIGAYLTFTNQLSLAASLANKTSAEVNSILVGAGNTYMSTIASGFYDTIKTNLLDKGATHIVLMNMPNVVVTPRITDVLKTLDQNTSASLVLAFTGWTGAFNTRLKSKIGNDTRIALMDAHTLLTNVVNNPSAYGITNAKDTACPTTGVTTSGRTFNLATCTDTALSAQTPPTGATGGSNWWKTYLFSDSFHPTPYGHQIMAQNAFDQMVLNGW